MEHWNNVYVFIHSSPQGTGKIGEMEISWEIPISLTVPWITQRVLRAAPQTEVKWKMVRTNWPGLYI